MPNLRGPRLAKRRLYANVIQSIILYAVPIWVTLFRSHVRHWNSMQAVHRRMNIKLIAGYRTVSYMSACLLAGVLPVDILAEGYADMYDKYRAYDPTDVRWQPMSILQKLRIEEGLQKWMLRIALGGLRGNYGRIREEEPHSRELRMAFSRTPGILEKWMNCKHRSVSFHTTQVLTGHGCFGYYLERIGKIGSVLCKHCDLKVADTAEHTLTMCPAWIRERHTLMLEIGNDLSISNLVEKMLENKNKWRSVECFCDKVMLSKEVAERDRERRVGHASAAAILPGVPGGITVKRGGTVRIRHDLLSRGLFGGRAGGAGFSQH